VKPDGLLLQTDEGNQERKQYQEDYQEVVGPVKDIEKGLPSKMRRLFYANPLGEMVLGVRCQVKR